MSDRGPATLYGAVDLQLRMVQAAVEAQLFGQTTHPVAVGRYDVRGPIGSGGMGSIVRAYDPELQREVALKLLRAERMGDASTRTRLVQEARAMARLSHPNVAMVFEVGEADGHLFVAMELIEGRNLREWLDDDDRPWPEILDLFLQAGRGLAAAHAKGLIHRDFKPENVMVDDEGRARVVDFGLAQEQGDHATLDEATEPIELPEGHGEASLTTTGTLLGTPAYMSPEQWKRSSVDARSDQFSFCVSLWEALCGQRPFPGDALADLMLAVTTGRPPDGRPGPAPGRVMHALRRGFATDPDDRWPDMDCLLGALSPRSRRGLITVGALGLAAVSAGAMLLDSNDSDPSPSPSQTCQDERARLEGVWDPAAREAASAGVLATGLPYAEDTWTSVATRLDRYADDWVGRAQTSCGTALTGGEATMARHARQQHCLEEARALLDHFADALANADEATVVDAAHEATRLPDLGTCSDDRRLGEWANDDTPEHAALVDRARTALANARRSLAMTSTRAGGADYDAHVQRAREAALEARDTATQAGHAPVEAEASLVLGRALIAAAEVPAAEHALVAAMKSAETAGDALTLVRARIYQVYVMGVDRNRTSEAIGLGEQSLAQLAGLGPRPLLQARLEGNLATAVARARTPDHERALSLHADAIARLREQLGEHHPHMLAARLNLGRALSYAQRYEDSEAELRATLEQAQLVWGDDHPNTARIWGTLGLTLMSLERADEAEEALTRSLRARERSLGPDHQDVASALYNLGSMLRRTGKHAAAVEHLRRGLTIRRTLDHGSKENLLPWAYAIGDCEVSLGEFERARRTLTEAVSLAERDGASPVDFGRVRFALARATAPDDPVAARVIGQSARDAFAQGDRPKAVAEVEQFLAALP